MEIYDPFFDPDRLHELIRQITVHGERIARLMMRTLAPRGQFVGQVKEKDKVKELLQLIMAHDMNLDIAGGKIEGVPFGNMRRAQNSLLREETLKKEFWDNAASTASA